MNRHAKIVSTVKPPKGEPGSVTCQACGWTKEIGVGNRTHVIETCPKCDKSIITTISKTMTVTRITDRGNGEQVANHIDYSGTFIRFGPDNGVSILYQTWEKKQVDMRYAYTIRADGSTYDADYHTEYDTPFWRR